MNNIFVCFFVVVGFGFVFFFLGRHSDGDITITACLEGSKEEKYKFCLCSTYIQLGVKLCAFTKRLLS